MKFTTAIYATAALVATVSSVPIKRDVDPALVPDFGLQSGLNPTGTGDCDGINGPNGQPIKIPCACPPDRASFLQSLNANVNAGHVVNNAGVSVSFPTDNSKDSQLARLQTAIVTLQNLNGPGVGCPAASTTFLAQQKAIQDGTAAPAPAPAAPAPAPAAPAPAAPAPAAGGVDPALIPEFGLQAGLNPTGTGDCDGINGIKIPCSCPPDRNTFIQSLNANVAAGHAVNNPSVSVSFPTGDSNQDKAARIVASLVTLQNLNGPGVGCPAASTTFSAQLAAVQ
ncbi:hypothetical protein D9758_015802 [Tetrapyrgos nigripes]|jgi:hypothetical protein|uniref:Uncharacterized protein n=1 Tax=Tetrapyrgos nigripes TaxID=182062 RepID=A0A8H5BXE4_9AGAR|nr:hypothetical protein D9758_015802 [Tetrapyrgos nigripes]